MSRLKEEIHPLLNDTVLRTLFNVCEANQLPVMRLVCKKWKEESLDAFRKTGQVQIGWWRMHIEKEYGSFPLAQYNDVDYDLQLTAKSFQNLKISKSDFMPNNADEVVEVGEGVTNEQDMEIWRQVVQNMRLEVVAFLDLEVIRMTVTLFNELVFQRLVSLETLRMKETNLSEDGARVGMDGDNALMHPNIKSYSNDLMSGAGFTRRHMNVIRFLEQFIPKLPRLAEFQLGLVATHPAEIGDQMVSLMRSLERQKSVPALDYLDLLKLGGSSLVFFPQNVILAWSGKFPLSTLKIDIGADTSVADMRKFFGSFLATLKHLHVRHESYPEEIKHKQVYLEGYNGDKIQLYHLEVLVIDEIFDTNILLLSFFGVPTLRKLTLADIKLCNAMGTFEGPFDRMRLFENMRFLQLNVLDLRRFYPFIGFTNDEVELLGLAAPNINELFLSTGKAGFSAVCKTWLGLHILYIYGTERNTTRNVYLLEPIDDEAITGIPDHKRREEVDEKDVAANITHLQSLRKFTLEGQDATWQLVGVIRYLRDRSVFDGFIKLPHLHHLSIPTLKLTDAAKEALASSGVALHDQKCNRRP